MARDPYRYFRVEARELTEQLGSSMLELERTGAGEVVGRVLRLAHTLKGAARVVKLAAIADHAHGIEDVLSPLRDGAPVTAQPIGAALAHLDAISGALAAIASPVPAPTPGLPPPGSELEISDDAEILDSLLDGLAGLGADLAGLGATRDIVRGAINDAERTAGHPHSSAGSERHPAETGAAVELPKRLRAIEGGLARLQERVERDLRQLHDSAERLRLLPARTLLVAAERAARDSAVALGKEIAFSSTGGAIRLDPATMRLVQDAIVQLVRNAVAHGIEDRNARLAAGKPAAGRIAVDVVRSGRRIIFRCEDDGRGIDVVALRGAALRRGRTPAEVERLERSGLIELLIGGGASTASALSEVAGRGIGMDIVRETTRRLGARIDLATEPGRFTRFELSAPLTMSSIETLRVDAGGMELGLPLQAVRETRRVATGDVVRSVAGAAILCDGAPVPLVSLGPLLGRPSDRFRKGGFSVVLIEASGIMVGLRVARILGPASAILRPLPKLALASAMVSGASLEASGRPVLVLDPEAMVRAALADATPIGASPTKHRLLVIDDSLTTRMLEQSILESGGFDVEVAASAEEGLDRVRARDYALVLVDVEMPGMDGFGFIEELRRDRRLHDLPAILVTSRDAPEDKQRGRDVGAQDYVVKSEFDQVQLVRRINELVGQ